MTEHEPRPLLITLLQGTFKAVEARVLELHGESIQSLASFAPIAAYEAFGSTLLDIIRYSREKVTDGTTGVTMDPKQDSVDAYTQHTERLLGEKYVDCIEFDARHVIVRVNQRRTLGDVIKRRPPQSKVALAFTVPPRQVRTN